ncbi:hypothetical protein [Algoriphagus antarcticus]|uniref:Uncharacterized protein n=1 Tax=Algoriphagus antarcticus TaxID=238540 RepID=A0A3E0E310_9BACT|nr:hypothetical protein [Algoriphagus antarcticus]REG92672.1 hypothetical protein C8N25_10272 [Algoriphagus antarcticus]
MKIIYEIVIVLICTIGFATPLIIWISKYLISHFFAKKVEKYKNELSFENMQFKSNIDRSLIEYQLKLNSLTAQKSEILKITYQKLVIADLAFFELMKPVKFNPPTREAQMADVLIKGNDFIQFYDQNEIYFSDEICIYLNEIKSIFIKGYGLQTTKDMLSDDRETRNEIAKELNLFYTEKIEGRISELKKVIKSEFKKELGSI